MPEPSHDHSGSHRDLVSIVEPSHAFSSKIDAIIVPSARPSNCLAEAARLARELKCHLVVLCSRAATRSEAIAFISKVAPGISVVAIDVRSADVHPAVNFATSRRLMHTPMHRGGDTSLKRNLGLLLARTAGWRRILFLDDDIQIDDAADIRRAGSLLDSHAAVGLAIGGYPDNSVVCHAHREAGGEQDTFIGGGALVVNVTATTSFFPNVYNEDWFFLLDAGGLRPITIAGTARQQQYDPFADPERARSEEFGDVLAEGLMALLDVGRPISDADADYWVSYIDTRRRLIAAARPSPSRPDADPERDERIRASLDAALTCLSSITPELCVDYLRAWHSDLERWQAMLGVERTATTIEVALKELRLEVQATIQTAFDTDGPISAVTVPAVGRL